MLSSTLGVSPVTPLDFPTTQAGGFIVPLNPQGEPCTTQHHTAFPRAHRTCADAQNAPHRTSFHSHRQIHSRTTQSRNCKTTNTPSVAPSRPRLINNYIALVTHTNALQPHKSSRRIYTHSQIPRGAVIFLLSTPQSTQ